MKSEEENGESSDVSVASESPGEVQRRGSSSASSLGLTVGTQLEVHNPSFPLPEVARITCVLSLFS